MRISEPVLFDTNLLIYAQDPSSAFFKKSKELINSAFKGDLQGYLSHQNLLEFFSVITNSKRVGNPVSAEEAGSLIEVYLNSAFIIIFPNDLTLKILTLFCKKFKIKSGKIFDLYLVSTMLANNVQSIITANSKDFKMFKDIKVVDLEEF